MALFLVAAPGAAQRYNFRSYTSQEGLPQKQILAIHQDSTGYLWFGTYGGLSRYNGAEFQTYTTNDGLASNTIRALAEDTQGRLVVGTQGGGVCTREGNRFRCLQAGDRLVSDYVRDLMATPPEGIWVATEGGATQLFESRSRHFTTAQGLPSNDCRKIARDSRNQIWIGTTRGLARLAQDRFEAVAPEILANRTVQMLFPFRDDLVVGTDSGLFLWRQERLIPFPVEPPPAAGQVFTDAVADEKGTVWLGTYGGVLHYDGTAFELLSKRKGLLNDSVNRVLRDREGSLWFGTEGGVSKLVPGPFLTYTDADGLPDSFVRAVAEDSLGRLWVGTRAGVSVREGNRSWSITKKEGLENERIYALAAPPEGGMLIGTRNGLAFWKGQIRRTYHGADGLPDDYVTSLLPDGEKGVWIGTARGLAHWKEGRITRAVDSADLPSAFILAMKGDLQGRLWLGLRHGGVAILDGPRVLPKGGSSGLTDEQIWSLDRDNRGRMWIGTNGVGAFVVDQERITHLTTREGLSNDFVWQVLCDPNGEVWMYTNRGLDRYDGRRFRHYGSGDGLLDLEGSTNSALRHSSGELWFGTGVGLLRYIPSSEVRSTVPPKVVLEEVSTSSGGSLRSHAEVPQKTAVTFRYACLSFRSEAAVRFRYRLLGFEQAWSPPTAERRIVYAGLPAGNYEFQVQGSLDSTVWSTPPVSFPFLVALPFWKTWWFWLSMTLLVAGILVAILSLRVRRVEAERQRLEEMVAARTVELEEKNIRLREMAIVDDLTKLHNRRYFIETLETELRKLSRGPETASLSLMLLDLDHFKHVNDTYGHLLGDQLLAAVADRIRHSVRSIDTVARYGGEEFAVILPVTTLEGAYVLASRIHREIASAPFPIEKQNLTITVSIGISHISGLRRYDESISRELISEADAALYSAKEQGRNRVMISW